MKIGIETERANHPTKTGVEHYAQQLILQFAEITKDSLSLRARLGERGNPEEKSTGLLRRPDQSIGTPRNDKSEELEFILYLRSEPEEWIKKLPKNFSYKVMPFPLFWTQIRLSWEMFWHPPDVLFIPASSMPLIHPPSIVVTVHDLAFMYFPETYTTFMRNFHKFEDFLVSVFAKKIIAVSESTKQDFLKYWKIDAKRIHVVHHGYTPQGGNPKSEIRNPKQIQNQDKNSNVKISNLPTYQLTNLQLPSKFILFLSTLQPRKNLEGLIRAFRIFKNKYPSDEHRLVVAGKVGWKAEKILEEIEKNKDIVVYLNHVNDEERALLYQKASALAVPSFYEGFGMWILEAFDAGVPVITSNISSMPEVGGDAAEYCNPHDNNDIARAIEEVLLNNEKSALLVQRGKERLKQFSWRKCAEETLEVLNYEA